MEDKINERIYFSEKTEDAIVRFNESDDMEEREVIFRNEIAYPLDKLAENIINRFKFSYVNEQFDTMKKQVVSFLVTNLHKYSKEKGKAFSYFSVIAKNHLIAFNASGYKEEKTMFTLSDSSDDVIAIDDVMGKLEAPDARQFDDVKEFTYLMVEYWQANVHKHFKKKRDIDIANAVVELFRRAENIEEFNKKALYIMIREMTNCKTGYITKVISKMKIVVLQQMKDYYKDGNITYR